MIKELTKVQAEAVAVADAHLNNVMLPTFTEVATRIDAIAQSMRGVREIDALNERINQKIYKRIRQHIENDDKDLALALINELITK